MNKFLSRKYFSIFIKTQSTPNPSFLKFLPGKELLKEGQTVDYSNERSSLKSPLAKRIFEIKGISRVMYGYDYISVGKKDETDWNDVKPLVLDVISDHFTKNLELFDEAPEPEDTKILDTDSETISLIKEIVAVRIRPVIQEDGGDIKYIGFDEGSGTVQVCMKGSCSGCPSSTVTLKNGIEKMLMHYVPEVKNVESVEDEDA
jgi:Fe-S cluster biogenesis protein NfuA